ncbi:hypothetical protein SAY87_024749 [Trapa incisa]|uniref:QWRF motif-containing protein 2 n=1 Tax=Trapa incisa TaxID=236973 RepID=A0AAN7GA37_9MYRT|nr:hypothetical protein SAY87_024749 [Trapa incisa]
MGAASAAIPDLPPPTPSSPSQALKAPNPPALSSSPAPSARPRKPKSKNVPSRYLSPSPSTSTSSSSTTTTATTTTATTPSSSSSRRFASPLLSRSTNASPSPSLALKRSQSVDRRRPAAARTATSVPSGDLGGGGVVSAASKLLITSTRSLSVSFQGEAFSLPVSKVKKAATPERRRATLTSVRDQGENSKPLDQQTHPWPARNRQANSCTNLNSLSRSVDYSRISDEKRKLVGFGSGSLGKLLQQSMIEECSNDRRVSLDGRLSLDLGKVEFLKGVPQASDTNSLIESNGNCDLTTSDTDSVSSGSTNGVQESPWTMKPKNGPRGLLTSARFWQETNSRLRRLQDPGSPLQTSPGSKIVSGANRLSQSKRFSSDSPLGSTRMMASPVRGATRPASPNKLWASMDFSPFKGMPSPSRVRPNSASLSGNSCAMPSILSFSMDVRRGKIGEDRIVEAHLLRLLYNRQLQWRFVNVRAEATFLVQRLDAEKNLWNAWVTISELRHKVTLKRMKLLLLRQKLKLTSILRGQIAFLEEWSLLEKEHMSSFLGATEALRASTLRLPVVGKASADIQNLKDSMGSAVDVMQAMASSICSLSSKVEEMNSLVVELVNVSAKERFSLDQCRYFLSGLAALQVKDYSLRTHILQLHRTPRST